MKDEGSREVGVLRRGFPEAPWPRLCPCQEDWISRRSTTRVAGVAFKRMIETVQVD